MDNGTFIGTKDGMWGFFINEEFQVISCDVDDCIKDAESKGYTVDYTRDGDMIQVHSVTK